MLFPNNLHFTNDWFPALFVEILWKKDIIIIPSNLSNSLRISHKSSVFTGSLWGASKRVHIDGGESAWIPTQVAFSKHLEVYSRHDSNPWSLLQFRKLKYSYITGDRISTALLNALILWVHPIEYPMWIKSRVITTLQIEYTI